MPRTFVAIGVNGPRTFSGACGLGSQRSMWLGAPALKIRMTDFALPLILVGADSSARSQSAQNRLKALVPVVLRKSRLVCTMESYAKTGRVVSAARAPDSLRWACCPTDSWHQLS